MADFEFITEASELEALAESLLNEPIVAVDTEADSFYHYFDKTCLVQIATKKNAYLVDPLALGAAAELRPLAPVFASPDVRVVFHAAEYDIFILKRDCGFEFANLFDTMVSAQLLGYPAIGLAALVEHHFGVKLPKDEQRSDWSRRPLTEKQAMYAASDVHYLIKLSKLLEKELKKAGRLGWAEDEFDTLMSRQWPKREFDKLGYLKIKGARKLDAKGLAVLRELYIVRDKRARESDRPPFKVLGNRTLLDMATSRPRTQKALAGIKGITDLIIRRMGKELLEAIAAGRKDPHGPIPKISSGRRRMDRRAERRAASLKKWRAGRAEELKIDPGVLCPNATIESIAVTYPKDQAEVAALDDVKVWLGRDFGAEIASVIAETEGSPPDAEERRPRLRLPRPGTGNHRHKAPRP